MSKRSKSKSESETMSTISVRSLQERLNSLYRHKKEAHNLLGQPHHMEYLWDLKEMALIAGKSSVEVPCEWLQELDQFEARAKAKSLQAS